MEKNQIESNLNRFPSTTRGKKEKSELSDKRCVFFAGRTMRERQFRLDNEKRLEEVEVGVHKIRQELRQLGVR